MGHAKQSFSCHSTTLTVYLFPLFRTQPRKPLGKTKAKPKTMSNNERLMSKLNRPEKRLITHLEHTLDAKNDGLIVSSGSMGDANMFLRRCGLNSHFENFRRMGTPEYTGVPVFVIDARDYGYYGNGNNNNNNNNAEELEQATAQIEAKDRQITYLRLQLNNALNRSTELATRNDQLATRNDQLERDHARQHDLIRELKTRLILGPVKIETTKKANSGLNISTSTTKRACTDDQLVSQPAAKRCAFGTFGNDRKTSFAPPITFSTLKTNPFASLASKNRSGFAGTGTAKTETEPAEVVIDDAYSTELPPEEVDDQENGNNDKKGGTNDLGNPDKLPTAKAAGECQSATKDTYETNSPDNPDKLPTAVTVGECQSAIKDYSQDDDMEPGSLPHSEDEDQDPENQLGDTQMTLEVEDAVGEDGTLGVG